MGKSGPFVARNACGRRPAAKHDLAVPRIFHRQGAVKESLFYLEEIQFSLKAHANWSLLVAANERVDNGSDVAGDVAQQERLVSRQSHQNDHQYYTFEQMAESIPREPGGGKGKKAQLNDYTLNCTTTWHGGKWGAAGCPEQIDICGPEYVHNCSWWCPRGKLTGTWLMSTTSGGGWCWCCCWGGCGGDGCWNIRFSQGNVRCGGGGCCCCWYLG